MLTGSIDLYLSWVDRSSGIDVLTNELPSEYSMCREYFRIWYRYLALYRNENRTERRGCFNATCTGEATYSSGFIALSSEEDLR
jgi:hypothetical protein